MLEFRCGSCGAPTLPAPERAGLCPRCVRENQHRKCSREGMRRYRARCKAQGVKAEPTVCTCKRGQVGRLEDKRCALRGCHAEMPRQILGRPRLFCCAAHQREAGRLVARTPEQRIANEIAREIACVARAQVRAKRKQARHRARMQVDAAFREAQLKRKRTSRRAREGAPQGGAWWL